LLLTINVRYVNDAKVEQEAAVRYFGMYNFERRRGWRSEHGIVVEFATSLSYKTLFVRFSVCPSVRVGYIIRALTNLIVPHTDRRRLVTDEWRLRLIMTNADTDQLVGNAALYLYRETIKQ